MNFLEDVKSVEDLNFFLEDINGLEDLDFSGRHKLAGRPILMGRLDFGGRYRFFQKTCISWKTLKLVEDVDFPGRHGFVEDL